MHNRKKGAIGEEAVAQYLVQKGYKILFKNWFCRWGELDLVMINAEVLTFIEVKYRTTKDYGEISESLTYAKKRHLRRTINFFLSQEGYGNYAEEWRFDLVCVAKSFDDFLITHYKSLSLT